MAKRKPKALSRRAPDARRKAILDAGLAVFSAQGFAATKLDDVAAKAGVAKGTIYLHFKDKQDLFEQIVRTAVAPVMAGLEAAAHQPGQSPEIALQMIFDVFRLEVLGTDRKHVLRLIIAEGARFPEIAEFYHREVVSKGLQLIGGILERRDGRRGPNNPDLAKYPQLALAPLIMAVIWDGLFSRIDPLDFEGMFATHKQLLLGRPGKKTGEPQ